MNKSDELNERERAELDRLRKNFECRSANRNLMYATALAGFIWQNHIKSRFEGDNSKLWDALPEETKQLLIDFVMLEKKGPG